MNFQDILTELWLADPAFPFLTQNKLNEQILATLAPIDQTILNRTAKNLYSFGASK